MVKRAIILALLSTLAAPIVQAAPGDRVSQPTNPVEIAISIAEKELGKPYKWGGDDPINGFDCSGLMVEALKSAGMLPRDGDWNAEMLAKMWPGSTVSGPSNPYTLRRGQLVFWNRTRKDGTHYIGHVEMIYAVYPQIGVFTIGASGGGSKTVDSASAAEHNAYVKIRPIASGWVKAVDPYGSLVF